jgi:glycosyltransferase involved in cell wall biosynthesis
MLKKTISAVVVAHNEEENLVDCLLSLKFANEIVVVLDKCSDNSKNIAANYADKIIEGSWDIEGARRNVALQNASGDWILEIDADERVSKELAQEILSAINSNKPCLFIAPIDNYVGKRLVKYGWLRAFGVTFRQTMHYKNYKKYHEDRQIHPTADVQGKVRYLKNPIKHLVDKDIFDMTQRFNKYTSWKAKDMISKGKIKGNIVSNFLSFLNRFFKAFILKKGFKEGSLGFLIAVFGGLYPLVSYLKAKNDGSK